MQEPRRPPREPGRSTVRPVDRVALIDQGRHSGAMPVPYDVVLLAGSPRRLTLDLAPNLAAEAVIEVDGEQWVVADIRLIDGALTRLICIYDV